MAFLTWIDSVGAAAIALVRYVWFLLAFLYLSIKTPWICRDLGQRGANPNPSAHSFLGL